jgi:hypothetical protein
MPVGSTVSDASNAAMASKPSAAGLFRLSTTARAAPFHPLFAEK